MTIYKRSMLVAQISATFLYFLHTVRIGCIVMLHKTCYVHSKIVAFFLPMSIIALTEPDTPLNNAYHVGSFNLLGVHRMVEKEHQAPLSVVDQIKNLVSLGLEIEDEEYAKAFLNDVSYFRLVKAFSLGLKPKNGKYNEGVTFSQIVQLYKFNCNFRQLLFSVIERIEVNLRCRLANHFSSKYGVLGYENAANFANADYHVEFLDDIDHEVERNSKSPFVRNFRTNYKDGKIPMYALVELFSFGTLSKFFKNMKNEDKKTVASTYGVGYTYFESWIESIAYVRNLCAHYGRLYNAKLSKTPMLYKQYDEAGIGNIRIFGVLICLFHLIPHDAHWEEFVDQLEALIQKYPSVNTSTMGFPKNWKDYLSATAKQEKQLACSR